METVESIHDCMLAEIEQIGGRVEKAHYCPQGKDKGCSYRKPRPELLLRAMNWALTCKMLYLLVTVSLMYAPDLLLELLQSWYSVGVVNQSDSEVL